MLVKINRFTSIEVKLNEENDTYEVILHYPFHLPKSVKLSHCYSTTWAPREIVKDIINCYGDRIYS